MSDFGARTASDAKRPSAQTGAAETKIRMENLMIWSCVTVLDSQSRSKASSCSGRKLKADSIIFRGLDPRILGNAYRDDGTHDIFIKRLVIRIADRAVKLGARLHLIQHFVGTAIALEGSVKSLLRAGGRPPGWPARHC
jgi:hypothetical protein